MGSEARTRLGLIAMLGVALLSFSQLFEGGDYPGPAMLGMFAAGALAIGARRLGAGTFVSILASVVALFWYLCFLFRLEDTFYGLPTRAAAEGLYRSLERAVEHARFDYAPVPLRPGYVVMIVAGMWLATAIGEMATFRWKRPLLASLPAVALFAVSMVVGTGAADLLLVPAFLGALLTFWGLESSHRLRSWGRWVPTWNEHREEEPDTITGGLARRIAVSCIAMSLMAPLVLPTVEEGLLSWRSGAGSGTGDGGGRIDPYVSIAPRLLNQTSTRLFTVQADEAAYWRLTTLSEFDGEVWRQGDPVFVPIEGGTLPAGRVPGAPVRPLVHTVRIEGLRGQALPAAGQARVLELIDPHERADDLRFDVKDGDLGVEGDLETDLTYEVSSVLVDVNYRDMVGASIGDLDGDYTRLPDGAISPEVAGLRDEWISGADGPFEELVAIQTRLRQDFFYSVENVADPTADLLSHFLLESRAGFCQHFATAFAALSRSLGYPTRVVVGFLPGEIATDPGDGYLVRGTDAHAWPEVFFEGFGWVPFEPTPRSDRVASAPGYTERETGPGDAGGGPSEEDPGAGGRTGPDGALDARALNDPQDDGQLSALELRELLREDAAAQEPVVEEAAWESTFARLAMSLMLLLAVYLVAVPALKRLMVRRRYRIAHGPREKIAAAFSDLERSGAGLASSRSPSQSPRSYARSLGEEKGLSERSLFELARLFERAEYAAQAPDETDAARAKELAEELGKALWQVAPVARKAAHLFSPPGSAWPRRVPSAEPRGKAVGPAA